MTMNSKFMKGITMFLFRFALVVSIVFAGVLWISQDKYEYSISVHGALYTVEAFDIFSVVVIYEGSSGSTAMQTAFDSAKYGDEIYLQDGYYEIDDTINGYSGISLKGSGSKNRATLDFSTAPSSKPMIIYAVNRSVGSVLTADALINTKTVAIDPTKASLFVAGEVVRINTNEIWKNNERELRQGELKPCKECV